MMKPIGCAFDEQFEQCANLCVEVRHQLGNVSPFVGAAQIKGTDFGIAFTDVVAFLVYFDDACGVLEMFLLGDGAGVPEPVKAFLSSNVPSSISLGSPFALDTNYSLSEWVERIIGAVST
ncbi:hypothetical protein [Vibrio owensii]|uniref:hypothetical protein n=1 Tax=Vibrio owensii TaxID=696485 RepID=UPI0018F1E01E|nr:hypothetical protein [Vibrio owensii]